MYKHIQRYLTQGFCEISTDSGTGSHVLVNKKLKRVVKFAQDPAYDKFVEFAMKKEASPALPYIFNHEKPLGDFQPNSNNEYTVTEIELLSPLSYDEQKFISDWIVNAFNALKAVGDIENLHDTYNLKAMFNELRFEAARLGVSLDLLKVSNFMKRENGADTRYVFIDPFN